jgi:Fe-Mn family superoxide dismutase
MAAALLAQYWKLLTDHRSLLLNRSGRTHHHFNPGGRFPMAHELPPLPYDYSALEPVIDTATMKLHHDMHHAAYVKNLNAALDKHPSLGSKSAEDLIRDLNSVPEDIRTAVRNNGGGHVNHTMFWKIMKPQGGGDPTGAIAEAIAKTFGKF